MAHARRVENLRGPAFLEWGRAGRPGLDCETGAWTGVFFLEAECGMGGRLGRRSDAVEMGWDEMGWDGCGGR